VYRTGSLEINTLAREVRLEGVPLPLTRLEFDLLETLARHAGQALSREQLLDQVWSYDYYGDARAVDSAVKRLRAKLLQAGGDPDTIATVRGVGYRLEHP
jgi:DNA-binding response OmpR family regulator